MLDRVVEGAQEVDQAKLESLLAGIDAAVGMFVDRLLETVAADGRDMTLEDRVDLVHPGPHLEPFPGEKTSPEASIPAFCPRRYDLKVTPSLSKRPLVASLPPTTPIEPVMVASSAKIVSEPQAT